MQASAALFRLLADSTRLRLLRMLSQDRFNVSELTAILALAQSGVSRHLGLLRDAGLVTEEREAGYVYYRLRDNAGDRPELAALLSAQLTSPTDDPAVHADEARLQDVLRQRRERFDVAADFRQVPPGRSWAAWARALGHLLPALDIADVGCGEGYLTLEMARWAHHVTGVDRSDDVLERAKALGERRQCGNVTWKKGDLSRLPLRDETVDLVVLSHALRYAADPERPLAEAVRVLRPSGRVLVLDLREHDQTWVQGHFGDRHLGFTADTLQGLLHGAGFRNAHVTVGTRRRGDPFAVLVASGSRPPRNRMRGTTEPRWNT